MNSFFCRALPKSIWVLSMVMLMCFESLAAEGNTEFFNMVLVAPQVRDNSGLKEGEPVQFVVVFTNENNSPHSLP
ncbi:MAG: hypothetical protein HUK40_02995 [Desulfobacter sp.]|nr:hypothetical protein [Desulfobacter sp.]